MKTLAYHKDMKKMGMTLALSKFLKNRAFNYNCSPVYMEENDLKIPRGDFVKVRNVQTGICGSDMSMYTIHQSTKMTLAVMPGQETTYMGHETVGIIEEIGDEVDDLKIGDRVIIRRYLPSCATKGLRKKDWCEACLKDDYVMCSNYGEANREIHMVGAGFGDYYLAPRSCVMKIDDIVTNDEACLYEPCAVSLHAVLKCKPHKNDKIVVLGGGMIGLNIVQFIKLVEPSVTVYLLEKSKLKQEIALKLGADKIIEGNPYTFIQNETNALYYSDKNKHNQCLINGVDMVYDSIGSSWAFNMGLRLLKARGTYVKVGIQMVPTTIDETPIWNQELNIIGINSYGIDEYKGEMYQSFDLIDKLVKEKRIKLDDFITHKFPLSEYKKGFSQVMFNGNETIKVVLECTKESVNNFV